MRQTLRRVWGRETLCLSGEAPAAADPAAAFHGLVDEARAALAAHGLALAEIVRTRLWAADRAARDLASPERPRRLGGPARSASSSYIAPGWFASEARLGLELLALRPVGSAPKQVAEHDPPRIPVRYVVYGGLVVLSGVTAVRTGLPEQVAAISGQIGAWLVEAGSGWERVVQASFYLHREASLDELRRAWAAHAPADLPDCAYARVDGFSAEGKLVEVEVTAEIG